MSNTYKLKQSTGDSFLIYRGAVSTVTTLVYWFAPGELRAGNLGNIRSVLSPFL